MNIDIWSASSGLAGTLLIFFFELSPRINTKGSSYLLLEQTDTKMAKKARFYKKLSYAGILLISASFLLQLIKSIFLIKN